MEIDEGIAVLLAAIMAIAGIFYASRQQRKALRKQHTYQVLDKLNDWPTFDANMDVARRVIHKGDVPQLCKDDETLCKQVDFLLDHYEFLCAAIINGDVDEGLVRAVESGRMTRLFAKLMNYVAHVRAKFDDIETWENVEFISYRWAIEKPDVYDSLLERAMLRPSMSHFNAQREMVWNALRAYADRIK